MSPRFDPATYPGTRPDGPAIVHQGAVWPLDLSSGRWRVPDDVGGAPVLTSPIRWSVAYGSNAAPARLLDKGLDVNGALLLPARLRGWRTAWESRRARTTGAIPLTLVRAPGEVLDTWVLGLHPSDTTGLDSSEGRGTSYVLGRVGPVAVAARWLLDDALAYGPGPRTRCLTTGTEPACSPALDQAAAGRLLDGGAVDLGADALPRPVEGPWPGTPLDDLPLFVYGTLQPGQRRWDAIDNLVEVIGPATTAGAVVATYYGYPAADLAASGSIHGTLVRPVSTEAAAALYPHVDRIEDTPRLFRRVAVPVEVRRRTVWAATYEWNPDQGPPPGTPVPDGRWT